MSSAAEDAAHRVEPYTYSGSADAAWHRLRAAIESMPRARVVEVTPTYLHAEFRSRIFRFVDDLELLLEPQARTIQVRSASRIGRSDWGVNRRRVEALRRRFASSHDLE